MTDQIVVAWKHKTAYGSDHRAKLIADGWREAEQQPHAFDDVYDMIYPAEFVPRTTESPAWQWGDKLPKWTFVKPGGFYTRHVDGGVYELRCADDPPYIIRFEFDQFEAGEHVRHTGAWVYETLEQALAEPALR